MGVFKTGRHSPQWDNQDLCRGNSHALGSPNRRPVHRGLRPGRSNLSGYVLVAHWPREVNREDSPGDDFLAKVCVEWENEAHKAADKGVRVTIIILLP
jgi:hypothetical protein